MLHGPQAVYIIESLLKNASDIRPDTIHADTQGQSLPVFGLAALLGFDLLPRIRNWHDHVPLVARHFRNGRAGPQQAYQG